METQHLRCVYAITQLSIYIREIYNSYFTKKKKIIIIRVLMDIYILINSTINEIFSINEIFRREIRIMIYNLL